MMSSDKAQTNTDDTLNLAIPLPLSTAGADMEFLSNPTYQIGVMYGKSVKRMHTAVAFPDNGPGVNRIHFELTSP